MECVDAKHHSRDASCTSLMGDGHWDVVLQICLCTCLRHFGVHACNDLPSAETCDT